LGLCQSRRRVCSQCKFRNYFETTMRYLYDVLKALNQSLVPDNGDEIYPPASTKQMPKEVCINCVFRSYFKNTMPYLHNVLEILDDEIKSIPDIQPALEETIEPILKRINRIITQKPHLYLVKNDDAV